MQRKPVPRQFMPWIIVAASVVIALLSFLMPVASTVESPTDAHTRTAAAMLVASLYVGASVYLLSGLQGFTSSLRTAYKLLAAGIILFSVSMLQLPIFGLFDLWETSYVESGGVIIPFAASMVVAYLGMRRFAKLLQISSKLTSFIVAFGIAVVFSLISSVVAQSLVLYKIENGEDMYIGVVGWALVFSSLSLVLAAKISRVIGQHYRHAMKWLALALGGVVFAILIEYVTSFIANNGSVYVDTGIYLLPTLPGAALFVWASQAVRLMTPAIPTDIPTAVQAASDRDYIDSIAGVANLASQPMAIDPILDDLRSVTARRGEGALSAQDKQRLLTSYHRLESYLATDDPLKHFSPTEVRQHVTSPFRALLENT